MATCVQQTCVQTWHAGYVFVTVCVSVSVIVCVGSNGWTGIDVRCEIVFGERCALTNGCGGWWAEALSGSCCVAREGMVYNARM